MSAKGRARTTVTETGASAAPALLGLLRRASFRDGASEFANELIDRHRKRLSSQPPLIQPKLTINPPNDRYEQEADRVAEQVMRMPEPAIQRAPT